MVDPPKSTFKLLKELITDLQGVFVGRADEDLNEEEYAAFWKAVTDMIEKYGDARENLTIKHLYQIIKEERDK